MTTETTPTEELEKFTTHNRREILFYLHQLINDGERISVMFDNGQENILTMLLDVDEANDKLIFDWGGSELTNHKLLQSGRNFFICTPHGVKNHFVTGLVRETTYKQRRAFITDLPDHYTRLQRREFFRLVLPMTRRPICTLRLPNGQSAQLLVVDLSIGGITAELPGASVPCEIGTTLPRASIDLKGIGKLEVDLLVRNARTVDRGGKIAGRIGCEYVKISHAMESQLQRFITDVQREERARLGT